MKPVKIENNVESWLSSLLKMLQYSVQCNIDTAAADIADEQLRILDFLLTNLAQVTLLKCLLPLFYIEMRANNTHNIKSGTFLNKILHYNEIFHQNSTATCFQPY